MQKGEWSKEDVISATKLYKKSKRQKRGKKGLPNFGRYGIIPVSYTHLDVYKRQV